ncbi:MAG: FlgB family protein [Pseudomonadota bacterium]
MLEELSIVRMASAMARHSQVRHGVIAQNVANADTPGYRAEDVKAFSKLVNEPFTARATRAGHVSESLAPGSQFRVERIIDETVKPSANGNSVSIEGEMIKSVEATGRHALATAIYRKVHELMRMGLGRGR